LPNPEVDGIERGGRGERRRGGEGEGLSLRAELRGRRGEFVFVFAAGDGERAGRVALGGERLRVGLFVVVFVVVFVFLFVVVIVLLVVVVFVVAVLWGEMEERVFVVIVGRVLRGEMGGLALGVLTGWARGRLRGRGRETGMWLVAVFGVVGTGCVGVGLT
jgi:hypothetical protein